MTPRFAYLKNRHMMTPALGVKKGCLQQKKGQFTKFYYGASFSVFYSCHKPEQASDNMKVGKTKYLVDIPEELGHLCLESLKNQCNLYSHYASERGF